jgi:hypothetical protein
MADFIILGIFSWLVFALTTSVLLRVHFDNIVPKNPIWTKQLLDLCKKDPDGWRDAGKYLHPGGGSAPVWCNVFKHNSGINLDDYAKFLSKKEKQQVANAIVDILNCRKLEEKNKKLFEMTKKLTKAAVPEKDPGSFHPRYITQMANGMTKEHVSDSV